MVQAMRFVPVQIVHQQFIWHLFNYQSFFPSVRHCEILFFPCHENSCCFERLHSSILRGRAPFTSWVVLCKPLCCQHICQQRVSIQRSKTTEYEVNSFFCLSTYSR